MQAYIACLLSRGFSEIHLSGMPAASETLVGQEEPGMPQLDPSLTLTRTQLPAIEGNREQKTLDMPAYARQTRTPKQGLEVTVDYVLGVQVGALACGEHKPVIVPFFRQP